MSGDYQEDYREPLPGEMILLEGGRFCGLMVTIGGLVIGGDCWEAPDGSAPAPGDTCEVPTLLMIGYVQSIPDPLPKPTGRHWPANTPYYRGPYWAENRAWENGFLEQSQ